jgi:hypothetical protein
MVTKRVLFAIRGGREERKKMGGRGKGKTLWRLKGFQLRCDCGDWKLFNRHHMWWPKTFRSPHAMVIERFSVAIVVRCLNLITIWHHWLNSIAIGRWQCILVATNGSTSIFNCHLETVKWQLNLFQTSDGNRFWKRFFEGIWVLKCNPWFIFSTSILIWVFFVFSCPLTTIAWNLGWVTVIISLVKGYVFFILQNIWTTLHLDFLRL